MSRHPWTEMLLNTALDLPARIQPQLPQHPGVVYPQEGWGTGRSALKKSRTRSKRRPSPHTQSRVTAYFL